MLDIKNLMKKVDALTAIIPDIKSDYETLGSTVDNLKAKISSMESVDPELQSIINSLDAKLGTSLETLKSLDDSIVNPVNAE